MKLRNVGQGDEGFRSVGAGAEHDEAADQIDLADGSGKGQIAAAGLAAVPVQGAVRHEPGHARPGKLRGFVAVEALVPRLRASVCRAVSVMVSS